MIGNKKQTKNHKKNQRKIILGPLSFGNVLTGNNVIDDTGTHLLRCDFSGSGVGTNFSPAFTSRTTDAWLNAKKNRTRIVSRDVRTTDRANDTYDTTSLVRSTSRETRLPSAVDLAHLAALLPTYLTWRCRHRGAPTSREEVCRGGDRFFGGTARSRHGTLVRSSEKWFFVGTCSDKRIRTESCTDPQNVVIKYHTIYIYIYMKDNEGKR